MLGALGVVYTSFAQFPSVGSYNVYYGHLHNHTHLSDGTGTPVEAYDYARNQADLDFFGVSDHAEQIDDSEYQYTMQVADSLNVDNRFVTFYGFEWSHPTQGHIQITNCSELCSANDAGTNTLDKFLNWIRERECIAFFNHPGTQNSTNEEFDHFQNIPTNKFVGIELWNKNRDFQQFYYNDGYYRNDNGLSYWDEALVRNWRLGAYGSDDNHQATWGTRNDFRTAVLADNLNRKEIYLALKARRFFTTLDKNIALSFKIDNSEMGSIVESGSSSLQIEAFDQDREIFTTVRLFKNGIELSVWNINSTNINISTELEITDGDFYYIIVQQQDGDQAISSPIWVDDAKFGVNEQPGCIISNPGSETRYAIGTDISIKSSAYDNDGIVSKVIFFANGNYISTDYETPFETNWQVASGMNSIVAKAYDNNNSFKYSDPVTLYGLTSTALANTYHTEYQVRESINDVEEAGDGSVDITSTDIELTDEPWQGNQTVGLRFPGINVPQGAIITSAYLQFTVDEQSNTSTNVSIYGHNTANSEVFTSDDYTVSSRETTSSQVDWNIDPWNNVGQSGESQRSPNLSSIVQEIVNRDDYERFNAMSFILTGSGVRIAESYDGSPVGAPVLFIEYQEDLSSTTGVSNALPSISLSSFLTTTYTRNDTVTIGATVSDTDGEIYCVQFFQNDELIYADHVPPYYCDVILSERYTNIYATVIDNLGASVSSEEVQIESIPENGTEVYTVSASIISSNDDVEEGDDGQISVTSSDLELVDEEWHGNQHIGLRFTGLEIPRGAFIRSASIQFTVDETSSGDCQLSISGHNTDDSEQFTSDRYNVTSRELTQSSIDWSPEPWNIVGQQSEQQLSPDLSSIIQEIVSRTGYQPNSAISLIISGVGVRVAESYDGFASLAPVLNVEYIIPDSVISNEYPIVNITSPDDNQIFGDGESVRINATATDSDGSITFVQFQVNDHIIYTDYDYPYSIEYTITEGEFFVSAIAYDNMGASQISDEIVIYGENNTNPNQVTVISRISSGMDDVEEAQNGSIVTNSTDIELVDENWQGNQTVGLRFADLNIPQGAIITNTYIQFTVDEQSSEDCNVLIYGHLSDNSEPFSTNSYNVSSRTRTYSSVNWNIDAWNTVEQADQIQRTPQLNNIVQEIVDRSGFSQSSAISFIITGNGSRIAESYDGSQSGAAALVVEYSLSSGELRSDIVDANITDIEINTNYAISVFPSIVTCGSIDIQIPDNNDEYRFIVIDNIGRNIMEHILTSSHSIIDVNNIKSGNYKIIVFENNKPVYYQDLFVF